MIENVPTVYCKMISYTPGTLFQRWIWDGQESKPYFVCVLKEYDLFCEELWDLNNGRTLCIDCHKKTETWGGKTKIC